MDGQGFYELLDSVYATGERFVASAMPIRLRATLEAEPIERFLDFIYEPMRDEGTAQLDRLLDRHEGERA